MENYCRTLPVHSDILGAGFDAPYCLVEDEFGSYEMEECEIQRCGKTNILTTLIADQRYRLSVRHAIKKKHLSLFI